MPTQNLRDSVAKSVLLNRPGEVVENVTVARSLRAHYPDFLSIIAHEQDPLRQHEGDCFQSIRFYTAGAVRR